MHQIFSCQAIAVACSAPSLREVVESYILVACKYACMLQWKLKSQSIMTALQPGSAVSLDNLDGDTRTRGRLAHAMAVVNAKGLNQR